MKKTLADAPANRISPATAPVVAVLLLSLLGFLPSRAWAQSPFINETLPVTAPLGGSGFTLTIKGVGFLSGAVVNWKTGANSTPLPTTYISATELTAQVSASLIATQQTAQVTVQNPKANALNSVSNAQAVPITLPIAFPTFNTLTLPNAVGGSAFSTVTGDFNNDGNQDVAVAADGTINVLLGNGNGTFTQAPSLTGGGIGYAVATGDVNGDGNLDLVSVGSSTVDIFLGNGNGTFTAASPISLGSLLYDVKVADLNGDGKLDLLITDLADGNLYTLLGNGKGSFYLANTFPVATGRSVEYLSIGDFDGNGTVDAAMLSLGASQPGDWFTGIVTILLGNGDGTFTLKSSFTTENIFLAQSGETSLGVADFNNDGKLDLAVSGCGQATYCADATWIYLGNGDGTFSLQSEPARGGAWLGIGDINGDGNLDLAFAGGSVSFLLGNGNGTFNTNVAPVSVGGSFSVAVADFNNDGRLDVVAASSNNGTLYTLLQNHPGLAGSTDSVNFGIVPFNHSVEQTITLTNISNNFMILEGIGITTPGKYPAVYSYTSACGGYLIAGASCQLDVYFKPIVDGIHNPYPVESGTLTISSNTSGSPLLIPLTGIGGP